MHDTVIRDNMLYVNMGPRDKRVQGQTRRQRRTVAVYFADGIPGHRTKERRRRWISNSTSTRMIRLIIQQLLNDEVRHTSRRVRARVCVHCRRSAACSVSRDRWS